MRHSRIVILFAALFWSSLGALALDLQQAKQQGLVAETDTGYLIAVAASDAAVAQLVSNVNAERRRAYERLSQQNGVPLSSVEKLAGEKAITKTPAGQKIQQGGQLRTK